MKLFAMGVIVIINEQLFNTVAVTREKVNTVVMTREKVYRAEVVCL